MGEKNGWIKLLFFVFFVHKNYSRSFTKLKLSHWCHTDCFTDVLTTFLYLGILQLHCCLWQGHRALWFHQKYLTWLGTTFRCCVISLRLVHPWYGIKVPWLLRQNENIVPSYIGLENLNFSFSVIVKWVECSFNLCSEDERRYYWFGMTRGLVIMT